MLLILWANHFWPVTVPVLDRTIARDEILTVFKDAWEATLPSLAFPIFYRDQVQNKPSSDTDPFVRASVQFTPGDPASLGPVVLEERTGVFTAQIFTVFGEGLTMADQLARVAQDAFEGATTPGGVWFRNVRVNEIGQDGDRFQTNVLVDFNYNEIK